jgi:hypothetical protein
MIDTFISKDIQFLEPAYVTCIIEWALNWSEGRMLPAVSQTSLRLCWMFLSGFLNILTTPNDH